MSVFNYKALDKDGSQKEGTISAVSVDVAINALQKRGFIISDIKSDEDNKGLLNRNLTFLERVKLRDLVIVSRQMATLFEAQISALRIFRLLSAECESPKLGRALADVGEDLQGGSAISDALAKHPDIFSSFYISMVKAGEESGRLDQTFLFLADYLDRTYAVTSKAKNALIYPAFIIFTFIVVMSLMLILVIPKINLILVESGQPIPIYTQIVIGFSDFLINYGIFLIIALVIGGFFLAKFTVTGPGKESMDQFKLSFPAIGSLYSKLYLSRIADNLNTMLSSGIPMVKALELTEDVVNNEVFKSAVKQSVEDVKAGTALSNAFAKHVIFPSIIVQLIKVGEETGNLGEILGTLAKFYEREVSNAVDTLVGLIEPIMIVLLSVGVGFLLASVLIPIYNISSAF